MKRERVGKERRTTLNDRGILEAVDREISAREVTKNKTVTD